MNQRIDWRLPGWTLPIFCLLISLLVVPSARAQGLGSITGTVTDPVGAVIPNAKVTATEVGTGQSRTAVSDAQGHYVFDQLRPSQYDISVEASGFRTFSQKGVTL